MKKKLFTVTEIATFLGLKQSTIYAWVHTKQIPYYKIGRLVKFDIDEIDEWIQNQKVDVIEYEERVI